MNERTHVPMTSRTTFRLGGYAQRFHTVRSTRALADAIRTADGEPIRLLGGGSNLLVNDEPLDGIVIANRIRGLTVERHPDHVIVRAGGGMNWDMLVASVVHQGWQGIECLSGIPGTVGAAPVQNIGAYGQSVADVLSAVHAVNRETGQEHELTAKDCAFGYRTSIFQSRPLVVTEVALQLRPAAPACLSYQDLAGPFKNAHPSLTQVRQTVLEIRNAKGALAMTGWPRLHSAGSFFKNPVVIPAVLNACHEELQRTASSRRWYWPQSDGTVKVAAGRLIETAGFPRGFQDGTVGISPYHALSLIAYRGARAADVAGLARRIQEAVLKQFGVLLEAEPQLWGWKQYPLLRP